MVQKRRHAWEDERGQGAVGTSEAEAQKRRGRQGDGRVTMRLENSPALLGSRNYAQLVLHLKHVQVYTASTLAVFLTPMALLTSVCAHTRTHADFYNYFNT